jgi:agmatine/peptidylarginine deiminase
MKKFFYILLAVTMMSIAPCNKDKSSESNPTNIISKDRMLLVLSAPSVHDEYYQKAFKKIVNFQINYVNAIIGNDNVIVIVDKDTRKYYEKELPDDILITTDVHDIWMRDFTTVNPLNPVQFKYTWASMTKPESIEVQESFNEFANNYGIKRKSTDLLIDGGNIVDNYAGKIITTTRFMEDNNLTYEEAKQELKNLLDATEVAIVEPDEEVLAHSDGMASWVDENTLLINDYSDKPSFRTKVMNELKKSFPGTIIIEVPVAYKPNPAGQWDGFESACGVNLNSTVTYKNMYLPTFNMPHDQAALNLIQQHTSKKIITINAEDVCAMGGSIRCLTWQLTGANAEKLILAAQKD